MITTKRFAALAALGVVLAAPPGVRAQGLNDLGRVLQDQVLGNRGGGDPNRERDAYERGRQDQADQNRREQYDRQRANDDRRRYDDDRRRRFDEADRRQRDDDRHRADQQRAWEDEQRARQQSRRY